MKCWNCGHDVAPRSPFCHNCASPLNIAGYSIDARLGEGVSSNVYLAIDDSSGDEVAIKQFKMDDPGARIQALREIEILQTIQHENIVRMIDADVERGFAVLEYAPGDSLEALLETQPRRVRENFREWMLQVCEALRTLHRHLIIHRDLNPKHILVAHDGTVRVIDFGVSKVLEDEQAGLTNVGHREYTAPEVQNESPYNHRADIYSLGAIFYAIWTGHPPITAPSSFAYRLQVTHHNFPPAIQLNSAMPRDISDLTMEMLEYSQERRVQSVDWVLAEIRGARSPHDGNMTIDDVQHMLARIYGRKNRDHDTEQLLTHLHTSISAVVSELRRVGSGPDDARIKQYLARSFAWLCAVVSSLNWRMSEIISLKYGADSCPYCNQPVCRCPPSAEYERRMAIDSDLDVLRALRSVDRTDALSIGDYQARFRQIYGARNQVGGADNVGVHLFLELGEVLDDLHRIQALLVRKQISMLHFELADLTAWYFALVNYYDASLDLGSIVLSTFPDECYRCHQPVCQCNPVLAEIREVDWR